MPDKGNCQNGLISSPSKRVRKGTFQSEARRGRFYTYDLKFVVTILVVCELSNDCEKTLPGSKILPKSVRLQNFFHIWETNSFILFFVYR